MKSNGIGDTYQKVFKHTNSNSSQRKEPQGIDSNCNEALSIISTVLSNKILWILERTTTQWLAFTEMVRTILNFKKAFKWYVKWSMQTTRTNVYIFYFLYSFKSTPIDNKSSFKIHYKSRVQTQNLIYQKCFRVLSVFVSGMLTATAILCSVVSNSLRTYGL